MDKEKAGTSLMLATFVLILAEVFSIISWKTSAGIVAAGGAIAMCILYGSMLKVFTKTSNETTRKVLEFVFAGWEFLSAYILSYIWENIALGIIVSSIVLLGTIQMTRKEGSLKKSQAKKANTSKKEVSNEVGEPEQVEV